LNNFCDSLLNEPITDWQNIDYSTALLLINEIIENTTNERILERNGTALEKKYRKTTGFISNIIFYSGYKNDADILEQLKKDTTIYL
jgi:hypothetical protein